MCDLYVFDSFEEAAAATVGSKMGYQIFVLDLAPSVFRDPDDILQTHILGGPGVRFKMWAQLLKIL